MNIEILCIGNLKEGYWRDAAGEYLKRLAPYCKTRVTELRETRLPKGAGAAGEAEVVRREGEALLAAAGTGRFCAALDIRGSRLSSEAFAEKLGELACGGESDLCFVIGGSLGLSAAVLARADLRLSFSDMTFPHQLMRVILLEQLYRGFKILRNEPYHK
ncbi:MAG: 23S rRNA (pseudouridine(1915)-N(3))-methyltransferase RlmH [Clostridiales Family XIII bacterium]|jgi:23S rRNA (pseudouridine1915-N3)-methyltransferase|nr:23S rRNA (pseudouridine(1915)-N(3))-methyltransferase RlmH [Clostridiales Family XIII bacterium]